MPIEKLVALAANGDEDAFREFTGPYRRELQFHCYRLLGSMADAEDALQETLLSAWRGLHTLEERSSVRAWLYRIATNRCLDARRASSRRPDTTEREFTPPPPTRLAEPTHLEPYPDELTPEARYEKRETVELAFIAALQRLPPRQRAALLLRDVLGFRTAEVAAMLDTTEESVKGALKRARAAVAPRDEAPPPDSPAERELVARFVTAWESDDIDGIVALLTEDAWLTMPPAPFEYQGADAIGTLLEALARYRRGDRFKLVATRTNTQPAFGIYRGAPARNFGLLVLTLRQDRIAALTDFLDPEVAQRFGLSLIDSRVAP